MNWIDLVGAWDLITYRERSPDGTEVTEPFGPNPKGILIYTEGAHMAVVLTAGDRPPLGIPFLRFGSLEMKALIAETFIAYGGTWRLDGSDVLHKIEVSSFPDWSGSEQRRHAMLDGNLLTLIAPTFIFCGQARIPELTWRKRTCAPLDTPPLTKY